MRRGGWEVTVPRVSYSQSFDHLTQLQTAKVSVSVNYNHKKTTGSKMVPSLVKGAAAGRLALRAAVAKNATPVLTAACSTSSEPPPPKAELKKGDQRSIGNRRWTVIGYANWSLLIRRNENPARKAGEAKESLVKDKEYPNHEYNKYSYFDIEKQLVDSNKRVEQPKSGLTKFW